MKNFVMFLVILVAFTVLSGCDWWRCTQDDKTFTDVWSSFEAQRVCVNHCEKDSNCDKAEWTYYYNVGRVECSCE